MIACVGHAAFQVVDLEASVRHATEVLGFSEVDRSDGSVYLSHGTRQHSLEYRHGPVTALDHVALQVRDGAALETACERLAAAGYELDRTPRPDPFVERNVRFRLAGGHVFDLFVPQVEALDGYHWQGQPLRAPSGVRPRRVGHVNVNFSDLEGARELFTQLLGFRVSDIVNTPDGAPLLYFLRCGTAHHAVAVAHAADGLFHYAYEVHLVQDLVRLGDALDATGGQLLWGPGRHGAGDNIAVYHADPSGVLIEYFADMQQIDDDRWQPRTWSMADPRLLSVWGVSSDIGLIFEASIPVVPARG